MGDAMVDPGRKRLEMVVAVVETALAMGGSWRLVYY